MKSSELIAAFRDRVHLPIDVNDVLQHLREQGNDDDIEFIGVDMDPDILQGQIKVFHRRPTPYGEPIRCANIYYHRGHDLNWQRMICCKELIHLIDPAGAYTVGTESIEQLASRIGLPPELQDPLSDGHAVNVDRLAEVRALALLLPLAARDALYGPYRARALSLTDVARIADIPTRFAGLAMHESWPKIHELL